jgi:hypothetical protein
MSNTVEGIESRALASLQRMDALLQEKDTLRTELQKLKRTINELKGQDEQNNDSIPVLLSA